MASPAFWEDNRRAQELVRERTELARTVTRIRELTTAAEDLGVMLELAGEAGDPSLVREIAEGVAKLRAEVDELDMNVLLSGLYDGQAAILSFHPRSAR